MRKIFVIGILLCAPAGVFALNAYAGKPETLEPPINITEVVERDGNIYSIAKSGEEIPLTSSGADFEPSLSTDQKWVTFVRENPKIMVEFDFPDGLESLFPARGIWVVAADGSAAPRLVTNQVVAWHNPEQKFYAVFKNPTFSNNNSEIYFLAPGWVTSDALCAVDLLDSSTRFVTDANSLDIVRSGFWADHIIVQKHRYSQEGSYDWNWLVSPQGKTLPIPLGENRADLNGHPLPQFRFYPGLGSFCSTFGRQN